MKINELTKQEFLSKVANYEASPDKWVYEGDKPCIVDFFATWCGPCKMLAPEIEKLADEFEGKAKILKVDVDQEQALAMRYGVQSIPTLIVFKNGVQTEKRLGYQPYPKLKEMLNR